MKRFAGIFVFVLTSALLSHSNSNAESNVWPPFFFFSKKTTDIKSDKASSSANFIMGLATYYASKFEGNLTATGETFHHSNLTAASNVFALNTWVKVTNVLTGKSIIVRINDRMHPSMTKKGRILDLTMTGAKQLKIVKSGIAKVKIEPIAKNDVAKAN